ncbi:MAG: FAD-dependent thymidylate synthase [Syntrophomonadaceae bacterium]|nr:FAD-dependent thymidylate synthase [Syntrophomonadaceae bacterium]MDD4562347.1 FAD-dependent thymidylate synthase [Syntrophomonadaceae bacterium]
MIIQKPRVLVPKQALGEDILLRLERYARVCYKSEDKMVARGNPEFLKSKLTLGHESIIEHEKATVMFIIDRGISHEIVRHRIAAYSQESTRYCRYSQDKFGNEIAVIEPYFFLEHETAYRHWEESCLAAEKSYMALLEAGRSAQEARSVLPNSLKTEIVVTYNMREWRHFFRLRCDAAAHPQMRQVAIPLLLYFQQQLPSLYNDIEYDQSFPQKHYAEMVITDDIFNPL